MEENTCCFSTNSQWEVAFFRCVIVISLILGVLVPWKKRKLKNILKNKSYSLISDYILNTIAIEMLVNIVPLSYQYVYQNGDPDVAFDIAKDPLYYVISSIL